MKLIGQKISEHAKAVVVDAFAEVKSLSHGAQINIFYAYGIKVPGNSIRKSVQIVLSAVCRFLVQCSDFMLLLPVILRPVDFIVNRDRQFQLSPITVPLISIVS